MCSFYRSHAAAVSVETGQLSRPMVDPLADARARRDSLPKESAAEGQESLEWQTLPLPSQTSNHERLLSADKETDCHAPQSPPRTFERRPAEPGHPSP